jgi:hypothetical protein
VRRRAGGDRGGVEERERHVRALWVPGTWKAEGATTGHRESVPELGRIRTGAEAVPTGEGMGASEVNGSVLSGLCGGARVHV